MEQRYYTSSILMYHTCSSFIIPGSITVKYLLAITIFSPSQKPLAEIHKWKCSLISFVNGTLAAHMSYQQALSWVGIQCPGPLQPKLLSSALLLGNGKCHCPHCLIRTSYFAFCFLQPTLATIYVNKRIAWTLEHFL